MKVEIVVWTFLNEKRLMQKVIKELMNGSL
jgi:hypothetical protein